MPAEASHTFALKAMNVSNGLGLSGLLAAKTDAHAQPKTVMGINFPHIVGLAAGLDKNADYIDALHAYGFGFIEIGTLTPRPQPGNPKPRMYRLVSEQAIINRLGFNNKGVEYALEKISRRRSQGIVGINIGKNFDTPVENANEDYIKCLRQCYSYADYVTVNISSPNTPGLRSLQFGDELNSLLDELKQEQSKLNIQWQRYVPIAVKLAPDMDDDQIQSCCESLLSREIDGVIVTNTTLDRSRIKQHPLAQQAGGLSGSPLTELSCDVLRKIKSHVGDRIPIIGVGGIMSGQQAVERLAAGADLLQIYTGFIYQGPELISEILSAVSTASTPDDHAD